MHAGISKACKHKAEFFVDDCCARPDDGQRRPAAASSALDMAEKPARSIASRPIRPSSPPAATAVLCFSCTSAHTLHRRTANKDGFARRLAALEHANSCNSHPTGVYGAGVLINFEGARGEGGLPHQQRRATVSWSHMRRPCQGPGFARRRAAHMSMEVREGRGIGGEKDHILLTSSNLGAEVLHQRSAQTHQIPRMSSRGVDAPKARIPVSRHAHVTIPGAAFQDEPHGRSHSAAAGQARQRHSGPHGHW